MKEILIMGSLPENKERRELYELLEKVCKGYAQNVSSPIATLESNVAGPERYELAFKKVREADLVIGELSKPSTGQGMEIREAAILNKPVIIVARSGSKVSGLVTSCPAVRDLVYYDALNDLELTLNQCLKSY